MRFWTFGRRRSRLAGVSHDDLLCTEDLLRRNVDDLMTVRERRILGPTIVFRGDLTVDPSRAVDQFVARFRPYGYTPFLRQEEGATTVQAWPLAHVVERRRLGLSVLLFVLTCLSTLIAGALFFVGSPTFDAFRSLAVPLPVRFLAGIPFAVPLLAILATHEFGHYFTARFYGASVSLPYFIPAPLLFGTLGAIIRMRSPARDRNSLFDIAAAGPLAGLVIAIPAMLLGLAWSTLGPPTGMVLFGDSLLRQFLVYLRFGPIPEGLVVHTHPIADAAWVGFFVTALNLFPIGQLDGGRIAYALFGARHRLVGRITFFGLLGLAAVTWSPNWLVWAAFILFLVGFHHPPPLDDITPLSPARRVVGAICLVLLILLVPPVPIPV
jgi:membrane-associated protease RseP (regulator of RpoE activity)